MSYVRSVHLHKDKAIFKVHELPVGAFAESLGLPGTPKIKFLSREQTKGRKNASRTVAALQAQIDAEKKDGGTSVKENASDSGSDESESAESSGEEHEDEDLPFKATESSKVCSRHLWIRSLFIYSGIL